MKVVDMHCDTISELLHIRKQWEHDTMLENHLQIDLNKMQKGDYLLQNFAMFVHLGREGSVLYGNETDRSVLHGTGTIFRPDRHRKELERD